MTQVRVNISTLVNASKIRREKRDGRDVIIVPSATLPDGVIMNGIRYPADVIEASYKTLEGRPAPLGHPVVNGKYVSASSPAGIVRGFFGSWNENVRRENGRVFLDKVIDVEYANQSDAGKRVLDAVEKQKPIHSSTGLLATLKANAEGDDAKFDAETMHFDHDAWLLDEPGAATPEQGVGIFVNSAGDELEVVNSSLEEDVDREMGWAVESLLRAAERKERLPLLERIKAAIDAVIRGEPAPEPVANQEVNEVDKEQFDALSAKVDAFKPGVSAEEVAEIVANALAPIVEAQAAKDEAEKAALVNQVVEAELLPEAEAKDASVAVLNALLARDASPKPAFRVNSAFKPTNKTDRAALAPKGE